MLGTTKGELHLLVRCLSEPQLDNLVDSVLPLKLVQGNGGEKVTHEVILLLKCVYINK